jgi:ankyrin repeat protein
VGEGAQDENGLGLRGAQSACIVPSALSALCAAHYLPTPGDTPLHYAASRSSEEVVRLLLAAGADKNVVNRDGLTPLALALNEGTDAAMLLAGEGGSPPPCWLRRLLQA